MQHGLTIAEKLLLQERLGNNAILENSWEIGRLVLDAKYRTGQDPVKQCIFLAVSYLSQNIDVQNLFASCTHVLSRLYRRFGFSVVAKNIYVTGSEEPYALIHGLVPNVLRVSAINNITDSEEVAQ
jgi:predicted GNAT family N-acyltransferase